MQTYDDLRKCWPLSNKPNERMRYTLPGRKLMEDRTSGNPDKFLSIFGLILDRIVRGFVTGEVVVPFLHGHGFLKLIIVGGDEVCTLARWNRNFAFFACDDEMTKVSSVCTVELVFQSLVRK
jgi:hypothetical protein